MHQDYLKPQKCLISIVLFLMSGLSIQVNCQVDCFAFNSFTFTKDGSDVSFPFYISECQPTIEPNIKKIVIVVHGTNRNGIDYYVNMRSARNVSAVQNDEVLIVAPQFITEDDLGQFNLGRDYPYWTSDGWKVGSTSRNESSNPRDLRISSYEVLDSLIIRLLKNAPNTKELIFTGHSAGGQLTNRYTASSPIFSILWKTMASLPRVLLPTLAAMYISRQSAELLAHWINLIYL